MSEDLCRVCLEAPRRTKKPFKIQDEYEKWTFAVMFTSITNLQVNDSEPQLLCHNCKRDLTFSFEFREKCLKTQEKLNSKLSTNSIFIKVEEELNPASPTVDDVKVESTFKDATTNVNPSPVVNFDADDALSHDTADFTDSDSPFESKGKDSTTQSLVQSDSKDNSLAEPKNKPTVTDSKKKNSKLANTQKPPRKRVKVKIMCDTCGKLVTKDRLNEHMKFQHSGIPIEELCYTCDLCDSKMKHKPSLIHHMKMFHLKFDRSKACELCGEVFRNGQVLLYHKRKSHTEQFPMLKCPYCSHTTVYTSKYKLHLQSHMGEASMKHCCDVCGRKFLQIRRLRDHMATHSDRRDFVCTECNASFKTSGGLSVHVRGVHSTQKGYECPVCSRAFSTNQNLRFHVTKQHPDYDLPPPGTVLKKNAARPFCYASGFSLSSSPHVRYKQ